MTEQQRQSRKKVNGRNDRRAPQCHCGSNNTAVYKTNGRIRYWKCADCGDTGVVSGPVAMKAKTVDEIQER